MNSDAMVLRAMLRLARRRQEADDHEIALRVGKSTGSVRAAIRRLDAAGLVESRARRGPRLTMSGLALALAMLPRTPRSAARMLPTPRAA
jgi:Mn-dependent DtxR family transcriptional regulator